MSQDETNHTNKMFTDKEIEVLDKLLSIASQDCDMITTTNNTGFFVVIGAYK